MYKLFLDDIRQPPDNSWIVARSFDEAVKIINEKGCPDQLSFDYHISKKPGGKNGKDLAQWLINVDRKRKFIPDDFEFYVHSSDLAGAEQIKALLSGYLNNK